MNDLTDIVSAFLDFFESRRPERPEDARRIRELLVSLNRGK